MKKVVKNEENWNYIRKTPEFSFFVFMCLRYAVTFREFQAILASQKWQRHFIVSLSFNLSCFLTVVSLRSPKRDASNQQVSSDDGKAFMTATIPLALFQVRFTVYRLCGWIDAARRVYGTPRFVALPAVHSHATPPVCCHYPQPPSRADRVHRGVPNSEYGGLNR